MELMEVLEGCFLFGRSRFTSVFYGNALSMRKEWTGALNDGFLLNSLTLIRLSRVLLDL